MEPVELDDNLYMYHYPHATGERVGQNIYALVDGDRALLIDAGYEEQARATINDLAARGIAITAVLPSHFHPDHIDGLLFMEGPDVYGNSHAVETVSRFYEGDEIQRLTPTRALEVTTQIEFGSFRLTATHAPGHSDCSVVTRIGDRFLHVGDLYMTMDNGTDVLPFVLWSGVGDHIYSLREIRSLALGDEEDAAEPGDGVSVLLSHGIYPLATSDFEIGIEDRISYLQALLDSDNTVTAEDAVASCSRPFAMMRWRDDVR